MGLAQSILKRRASAPRRRGVSSKGAENWNKLTARPLRRQRIGLFSQRVHFHGRCGAILLSLRCAS